MLDLNLSLNIDESVPEYVTPTPDQIYDILIIGAGPAGLNAALYANRKGLNVAVFGERVGGQMLDTNQIDNYIGSGKTNGYDLAMSFENDTRQLGVPILAGFLIESWSRDGDLFALRATDGNTYRGRLIILATGSSPRHLNIPGENELRGRGVSYCAICDGPLFRGKRIVIVGGGDSAIEAAIDTARIAKEVIVVQRSEFRASPVLMTEVRRLPNVHLFKQTDTLSIEGKEKVTGCKVYDKIRQEERIIETDAVFIEIGHNPHQGPFEGDLAIDENRQVIIDEHNMTSIPGVFAAGDLTPTPFKQIVIAAAEGAKAALSANNYLVTHHPQTSAVPLSWAKSSKPTSNRE